MKKRTKQWFSYLLSISMLTSMVPIFGTTAQAAVSDKSGIEVNVKTGGGAIYFGKMESNAPALYRVVAQDSETMTLFYDGNNIANGILMFDGGGPCSSWEGSQICLWLNGAGVLNRMTGPEQEAIPNYGTTETLEQWDGGILGEINIAQKIVLPSRKEVKPDGTWEMVQADLVKSFHYWLRAKKANDRMDVMRSTGTFEMITLSPSYAVAPAFKVDKSSILFASAAAATAEGKSGTASATLPATATLSGAQKLTIVDSALQSGPQQ